MSTKNDTPEIPDCPTEHIINHDLRVEFTDEEIINSLSVDSATLSLMTRVIGIKANDEIVDDKKTGLDRYEVQTAQAEHVHGLFKIEFNPVFVGNFAPSPKQFSFISIHEVFHCILWDYFAQYMDFKNRPQDYQAYVLAMDAYINALIVKLIGPNHPATKPAMNFYSPTAFPYCMLRPKSKPKNWRDRVIYKRLYSAMGIGFEELMNHFKKAYPEGYPENMMLVLMADHGDPNQQNQPNSGSIPKHLSKQLTEELGRKIKSSPEYQKELAQKLAEKRRELREKYVKKGMSPREAIREANKEAEKLKSAGFFDSILFEALNFVRERIDEQDTLSKNLSEIIISINPYSKLVSTFKSSFFPSLPLRTVMLNYRDRSAMAKKACGIPTFFYKNKLLPKDFGVVSVYIDVSGSMCGVKEYIYKLFQQHIDLLDNNIYLFSNGVEKITHHQLIKGEVFTTGGTDDCFLPYMIENKHTKVLLVTDGWFNVHEENLIEAKKLGIKILP
ncbi:MAG: hypothetical protein DRM99_05425, partial [Thermoplasmata archaeon]